MKFMQFLHNVILIHVLNVLKAQNFQIEKESHIPHMPRYVLPYQKVCGVWALVGGIVLRYIKELYV